MLSSRYLFFSSGGPKQNAVSLSTPVCDTFFIHFHMVALRWPSIVVLMTAYFKDSDRMRRKTNKLTKDDRIWDCAPSMLHRDLQTILPDSGKYVNCSRFGERAYFGTVSIVMTPLVGVRRVHQPWCAMDRLGPGWWKMLVVHFDDL